MGMFLSSLPYRMLTLRTPSYTWLTSYCVSQL